MERTRTAILHQTSTRVMATGVAAQMAAMPTSRSSATPLALLAAGTALAVRERRLRAERAALARRAEQLQRASDVRTRWLAGLSHELRTPLAAMVSFAQVLADTQCPGERRESAAHVELCGDHLLALLDELRDLTALDAGALRLAPRPTDPASIAGECLSTLRSQAASGGVRLRLDAPGQSDSLLLDPTRLRQVMLNYLANAIRFTRPGGTVTLALRRVQERLQIAVSDTGVGISDADQRRVFEERFHAGGAGHGGSGMGLAIVRRLVEAQDGEVGVTSRPGLGSTFYAWLPWVPATSTVQAGEILASRARATPGHASRPAAHPAR